MEYRKQSHCVYRCEYHLVFSTKYRRKIFNDDLFFYMKDRLKKVKEHYPELDILEINHDIDHIHILMIITPKMGISQVVSILKSHTSKDLKKKLPFLKKVYWGTDGIWYDGYFVSTVGVDKKVIRRYIEHQSQEDSGQAQLVFSL